MKSGRESSEWVITFEGDALLRGRSHVRYTPRALIWCLPCSVWEL